MGGTNRLSLLTRLRHARGRLAVVAGLLAVIVAIGLAVGVRARARDAASEELRLAGRQLIRGLETRNRQTVAAVRTLADDAALRRAAASGDQESARSILADQRQRMGADLLVLVSPTGTVASDSLRPARLGASFPLSPLLDEADRAGEASRIVVMDGSLYWLVFVPLRAPTPIAWLCAGRALDDRAAADLRRSNEFHVSFVRRTGAGLVVHASTLDAEAREELRHRLSGSPTASTIGLGGASHVTHAEALSADVLAVLHRPFTETLRRYDRTFILLAVAGGAGLVLVAIGALLKV